MLVNYNDKINTHIKKFESQYFKSIIFILI